MSKDKRGRKSLPYHRKKETFGSVRATIPDQEMIQRDFDGLQAFFDFMLGEYKTNIICSENKYIETYKQNSEWEKFSEMLLMACDTYIEGDTEMNPYILRGKIMGFLRKINP